MMKEERVKLRVVAVILNPLSSGSKDESTRIENTTTTSPDQSGSPKGNNLDFETELDENQAANVRRSTRV